MMQHKTSKGGGPNQKLTFCHCDKKILVYETKTGSWLDAPYN